ncbi:hypothetical protein SELMODRAFT_404551 [Selaginella moellendorffii]|uniref:Uncharacterized protein n=1 Tax=Selaginella moellendorffii TaxID=88036 RepID=D8QVP7_SELML|nr:hypothetical protein SELMODRAFT_404551 [Selaginella moellendorffii]
MATISEALFIDLQELGLCIDTFAVNNMKNWLQDFRNPRHCTGASTHLTFGRSYQMNKDHATEVLLFHQPCKKNCQKKETSCSMASLKSSHFPCPHSIGAAADPVSLKQINMVSRGMMSGPSGKQEQYHRALADHGLGADDHNW